MTDYAEWLDVAVEEARAGLAEGGIPIGGALIYSQITLGRPHPERVALAWRVATYSAIVMLVSLLASAAIAAFGRWSGLHGGLESFMQIFNFALSFHDFHLK